MVMTRLHLPVDIHVAQRGRRFFTSDVANGGIVGHAAIPSIRTSVAMSSSERPASAPNLRPVFRKMLMALSRGGVRFPLRMSQA